VNVDTTLSDFRNGAPVLFYQNNSNWQVRQITALDTTSITLGTPLVSMSGAYAVPVLKAAIANEVEANIMPRATEFSFKFNVSEPRDFTSIPGKQFYFSFCITPHISFTTPSSPQNEELHRIVDMLRGMALNGGARIDVRWYFWNDINRPRYDYLDCGEADFDDMDDQIDAAIYQAGTIPNSAATWALDWFETENPNPGDGTRQDVWIFTVSQGATNLDDAAATAADMINRTAPFDGYSQVNIYGMIMDQTTSIQIVKLDNMDHDKIPNLTSTNNREFSDRVQDIVALDLEFGYRYKAYEILVDEPVSSSGDVFSKKYFDDNRVLDFGGKYRSLSYWGYGRELVGHTLATDSLEEMFNLKMMMHRFAGRYRPFWIPTFNHELNIQSIDTAQTRLVVKNFDYDEYSDERIHLLIRGRNSRPLGYEVVSVDSLGANIGLNLDRAIPIDLSEIELATFIGLGRLDNDTIEINWKARKYAETTLMTLGIAR
jgi:hypothetical protein